MADNELEGVVRKMLSCRDEAIRSSKCVCPPFGCGQVIDQDAFRDELSAREYRISGLCQRCQDNFFSTDEELQG